MSFKNEEKIVVTLLIALIAFGIGSGIGISVGFAQDENTTKNNITNDSKEVKNTSKNTNVSEVSKTNNTSKKIVNETAGEYYSPEELRNMDYKIKD